MSSNNDTIRHRASAIIIKDRKLLLVTGSALDIYWTPGGKIDYGETAEQALVRELQEELGLINVTLAPYFSYIGPAEDRQGYHFYETTEDCFLVKTTEDIGIAAEIEKSHWFAAGEIEANKPEVLGHIKSILLPRLTSDNLL